MPRSLPRAAFLVLLTAVYVAAGRFGLSLAFVNESASAVWPPTGIAIAAWLLAGAFVWPAIFAGAFLVNVLETGAIVPSVLIGLGNTAEAAIAGVLVARLARGPGVFEQTPTILRYLLIVVAAAAAAASAGLLALESSGLVDPGAHGMTWLTWWTGDLSSALLITPTLVTWLRSREPLRPWPRRLELLALVAVLGFTAFWVFGPTVPGSRNYPLMYASLPVMLWASLRFGPRGATGTVLVTAVVASMGTVAGFGPFARHGPNEALLLLQSYLCVKMLVMLSLAAEVEGRRQAEQQAGELNADLARRVEDRTRELQAAHGRLVEAQAVAHIGSWEWDIGSGALWWSDEMYRVYGLEPGLPISYARYVSLQHPEDRARTEAIVTHSIESGEPFDFEHRAIRPDGSVRVLHAVGAVVRDAQGRPIRLHGVGHDVTALKQAEEERLQLAGEQAARREAEDANRMKDYFLATLSHELRTPMNAIVGWATMLKERDLDPAMEARALDAILRNVALQAQLVSDILDIGRIRSGTLTLDPRPVPLREVVDGALEIVRAAADEKAIRFSLAVPEGTSVIGDARRLQQIFWNVLSNAAKFVPPGGHIEIAVRANGRLVEIAIADDGPGIPEGFLPFIFDQFRQADASLTREHGGLGLGLAISQHLVEMHGGTITAANRPGGGAVFRIVLPARD